MIDAAFRFTCPHCGQHIRAYREYCGDQLVCPTCENQFTVPNQSWVYKNEPQLNDEMPRIFDDEELALLTEGDIPLRAMLGFATTTNCWEFTLTAELLRSRLEPLGALLTQYGEQPGALLDTTGSQTAAATVFLTETHDRFVDIFCKSYEVVLDRLEPAMYDDSIAGPLFLANLLEHHILDLCELFRELMQWPLPPDSPYPAFRQALHRCAYHYWDCLDRLAGALDRMVQYEGRKPDYQVSLVPPAIHALAVLRAKLLEDH
jgi:hypothetical protein